VFLDAGMTENPDIVEVGESAAPTAADCDTLDRLSVFKFVVPWFRTLPFIERFVLNV